MMPCMLLSVAALAGGAVAASQMTWGAVVFTYHGEKTPDFSSSTGYNLSPLGATQALQAGATIRARYLSAPVNGSDVTTTFPVNGLSTDNIDNTQLSVLSTNDEFVSASATAFMQGLYPPVTMLVVDEETKMGNGTLLEFPLGGYQYPNIGTVGSLDLNFIWVAGNDECTSYSVVELSDLSEASYSEQLIAYGTFYESLKDSLFWSIDEAYLNYYNAWLLWELGAYEYQHNTSVFQNVNPDSITQLFNLASQQQWLLNTPNSVSTVSSIAGQTFASKVVQQFKQVISSGGVTDKLSLLFGSFSPFLSFFALSDLAQGPAADRFNSLPLHGSVMAFELFSTIATNDSFPSTDDLWVRFLFRNGTADDEKLIAYPLFGNGNANTDLPWTEFVQGMGNFALGDVAQWCSECGSVTLFCEALTSDITATPTVTASVRGSGIAPPVAGVIGAAVTIAVLMLLGALLVLFGFRIDRRKRGNADAGGLGVLRHSGSGGGGFKGAEKLASDTDLHLKGGAGASIVRHERVGSWELNESTKHNSLDKEVNGGRVVSMADYGRRDNEDGMDPFGEPVKAADQV